MLETLQEVFPSVWNGRALAYAPGGSEVMQGELLHRTKMNFDFGIKKNDFPGVLLYWNRKAYLLKHLIITQSLVSYQEPWPLCIHQYLQHQYPPVPSLGLRSLDIHMSHSLLDILIIRTDTWCLDKCMCICMGWSALILNMIFCAWRVSVRAIFLPPHSISSLER